MGLPSMYWRRVTLPTRLGGEGCFMRVVPRPNCGLERSACAHYLLIIVVERVCRNVCSSMPSDSYRRGSFGAGKRRKNNGLAWRPLNSDPAVLTEQGSSLTRTWTVGLLLRPRPRFENLVVGPIQRLARTSTFSPSRTPRAAPRP